MKRRPAWVRKMLDTRAVYRFERTCEHALPRAMRAERPMAELQALAAKVWADYGRTHELYVRADTGTSHCGKNVSYCQGGRDGEGREYADIVLARHERRPFVVLHELAHALGNWNHGPRFVRCYIKLMVKYGGAKRADLVAMMAEAGVRL